MRNKVDWEIHMDTYRLQLLATDALYMKGGVPS